MVFFVCESCNETLKKNQVEKHCFRCKNCYAVTCVDCQKVFHGNEYVEHTSCISEAEKYEKSLYKGKKEKLNPQDAWNQCIETAFASVLQAPVSIRTYLEKLSLQTNVPRNKSKFGNFIKNSLRVHNDKLIDEIWMFLEKHKPSVPVAHTTAGVGERDNVEEIVDSKGKSVVSCSSSKPVEDEEEVAVEGGEVEEDEEARRIRKEKKREKKERKKEKREREPEAIDESEEIEMHEEKQEEEEQKKKNKKKKKA